MKGLQMDFFCNRSLGILLLSLLFLLQACGITNSHIDGQLNVLRAPSEPISDIRFLEEKTVNLEDVIFVPRPDEDFSLSLKERSVARLKSSVAGFKQGGMVGAGWMGEIFCHSSSGGQSVNSWEGVLFVVLMCPTMILGGVLVGGLVGGVGGAVVGPKSETSTDLQLHSLINSPKELRYIIFASEVSKKIEDHLIQLTSNNDPTSVDSPHVVRFSRDKKPKNFMTIEPVQIGLIQVGQDSTEKYELSMKFRIVFSDTSQIPWAIEEIEAKLGEYRYERWGSGNGQLLREGLELGAHDIATQILAEFRKHVTSLEIAESVGTEDPLSSTP